MTPPLSRSPLEIRSGSPLGPGGPRGGRGRTIAGGLGALWIGAATLVMLADRAPGLLRRLSVRVDVGGSRAAQAAAEAPLPESDFEIHLLVWFAAALLVGLATWSWPSLALAGLSLFAFSVAVEGAQHVLTATRSAQLADVLANAAGVAGGMGLAGAFAVALAGAAGWRRKVRR